MVILSHTWWTIIKLLAKKVVSNRLGLVDFANCNGVVNSVRNFPYGQVNFLGDWLKLRKNCNQSCSSKFFGLSEMSFRLVCTSNNLPKCHFSRKNIPYECTACKFTHSKQTDEKWIAKPFKMERPNGWRGEKNFWTDEVKLMNSWRKFLNGCSQMDERLKKNFWTDEIEWMSSWRKIMASCETGFTLLRGCLLCVNLKESCWHY